MAFAKEFFKRPENWRNDVTFAESKYCIFGSDRKSIAWCRVNKALKPQNLEPTLKHGGDSVIVWGCISSVSVDELMFIEDILDKDRYLDLLKKQSAKKCKQYRNTKYFQILLGQRSKIQDENNTYIFVIQLS